MFGPVLGTLLSACLQGHRLPQNLDAPLTWLLLLGLQVPVDPCQQPVADVDRRQWDVEFQPRAHGIAQRLLHFEATAPFQVLQEGILQGRCPRRQDGPTLVHGREGLGERPAAERLDGEKTPVFEGNPQARGDVPKLSYNARHED